MKAAKNDDLTIGSKVYLIHRKYCSQKIVGARIILARVKTFERTPRGVEPILGEIGNKRIDYKLENYVMFIDINEAIKRL